MTDLIYYSPIIITVFTILIAWLIARLSTMKKQFEKEKDFANDPLYHFILDRQKVWLSSSMLWLVAHYLCVIISFEASVSTVYLAIKENSEVHILVLSIITTSLILFEFAVHPKENAATYRRAFECADELLNDYIAKKISGEVNDFNFQERLNKAEREISRTYYM